MNKGTLSDFITSPHLAFSRYLRVGVSVCSLNRNQTQSGGYQDSHSLPQTSAHVEEAACACAQRHGRRDELVVLACDRPPRPQHVQEVVESPLGHEVHNGLTSLLQEPTARPAGGHGTHGCGEETG